jgi:hypothetical protein
MNLPNLGFKVFNRVPIKYAVKKRRSGCNNARIGKLLNNGNAKAGISG